VPLVGRVAGRPRLLPGTAATGALLVVDVQRDFAAPEAIGDLPEERRTAIERAVDTAERLVAGARDLGLRVVWIRLDGAGGQDWTSIAWLMGHSGDDHGLCVPGTPGYDFYRLAPLPGEPVVDKRRYSGFVRTGLEELLRDMAVEWVACCGLTSGCCVFSTAWDAMQRDFAVVYVADATDEIDEILHDGALRLVAENVGLVVTTDDLLAALARSDKPSGS
jgi:nicotinamidase-related amidase